MDKIEIGIAEISYDKDGKLIAADFVPTKHITDLAKLCKDLEQIKPDSADAVQRQGEVILAEWFSHMNAIELADREKYHIVSEMLICMKWANQKPKYCRIRFSLKAY